MRHQTRFELLEIARMIPVQLAGYRRLKEELENFARSRAISVDAEIVNHDSRSFTCVYRTGFLRQEVTGVLVMEENSIYNSRFLNYRDFGCTRIVMD